MTQRGVEWVTVVEEEGFPYQRPLYAMECAACGAGWEHIDPIGALSDSVECPECGHTESLDRTGVAGMAN